MIRLLLLAGKTLAALLLATIYGLQIFGPTPERLLPLAHKVENVKTWGIEQ